MRVHDELRSGACHPCPVQIHAAILDPLPLYCDGAVVALRDLGYTLDRPDDIWSWLTGGGLQVVVVSLCAPADWRLLADLHDAHPEVRLLALVDDPAPATYIRALTTGAVGVIPRTSSAEALRDGFRSLLRAQSLLPITVVRLLVDAPPSADQPVVSTQERGWLRDLAGGTTVAQLATTAGYSERMMFRMLRALYAKLHASNRTEALMHARDQGWI